MEEPKCDRLCLGPVKGKEQMAPMHVLLSYGYHEGTTGVYLERALRQIANVTTVGAGRGAELADLDILIPYAAARTRPECFLYVDSGKWTFPRNIHRLPIPTACYLIDTHIGLQRRRKMARLFDFVFVAQRDDVHSFRSAGGEAIWLPLAADQELCLSRKSTNLYDLAFVGQLHTPYYPRAQVIGELSKHVRMNEQGRYYSPEEMATVYSESAMVLNLPIRRDVNMRVFEALGCGSLLISTPMANAFDELLTPGEECIIADGPLLPVICYWLAHAEERERIALAGRRAVLARHTYLHRARSIVQAVLGRDAPLKSVLKRSPYVENAEIHLGSGYSAGVYRSVRDGFLTGTRPSAPDGRILLSLAANTFGKQLQRRYRKVVG